MSRYLSQRWIIRWVVREFATKRENVQILQLGKQIQVENVITISAPHEHFFIRLWTTFRLSHANGYSYYSNINLILILYFLFGGFPSSWITLQRPKTLEEKGLQWTELSFYIIIFPNYPKSVVLPFDLERDVEAILIEEWNKNTDDDRCGSVVECLPQVSKVCGSIAFVGYWNFFQ